MAKQMSRMSLQRLVYAALSLSLCIVLPFLTGQLRDVGNALLPMHLPVLLCGLICGPSYGLAVGAVAPLLRSLMLGMPPLFPGAVGMCVELAVYGLTVGPAYRLLPKKAGFVYLSLITAMVAGRLAGGAFKLVLLGVGQLKSYTFSAFLSGYVIEALPGIALQILLVPLLFFAMQRARAIP